MSAYQPLDCDLHDYLEIACSRSYVLQVELVDGRCLLATALTTRTAASKEEFLLLETEDGQLELRLDVLLAITPLDAAADFGRIELAQR